MKTITYLLMPCLLALLLTQCKKKEKLENPYGLLLLGSDTSLAEGRYVIRTPYGCSGYANILSCENADEVLSMNNALYPTDHIRDGDVDSQSVWYVKKVRYVSPDPDYALAFAYRIYQYRPNGAGYRFLSFTAKASPGTDSNDEIGDGGGPSLKVQIMQRETYPPDPPVPELTTSEEPAVPQTRFSFQFYGSEKNGGFWHVKAGGHVTTSGSQPVNRWKLCTGYWEEASCDGNALPLHFRGESSYCEQVDPGSGASRRCYMDEFAFEKVY